jgi:hypothetical protein
VERDCAISKTTLNAITCQLAAALKVELNREGPGQKVIARAKVGAESFRARVACQRAAFKRG